MTIKATHRRVYDFGSWSLETCKAWSFATINVRVNRWDSGTEQRIDRGLAAEILRDVLNDIRKPSQSIRYESYLRLADGKICARKKAIFGQYINR